MLFVAALLPGCAARNTLVHRSETGSKGATGASQAGGHPTGGSPVPPAVVTAAERASSASTIEVLQPQLRAALAGLEAARSAGAHVRVGQAYYGSGVLDSAMEHFDRALEMDARSAAAYDGRARVWRQWGLLGLAIGDAHRAVYFAPRSAEARNTLGTILIALGDSAGGAGAYRCAVHLDPSAAWARTNLQRVGDTTVPSLADCSRAKAKSEN
jgi:tetratricopeptide (TPR) repeat protein